MESLFYIMVSKTQLTQVERSINGRRDTVVIREEKLAHCNQTGDLTLTPVSNGTGSSSRFSETYKVGVLVVQGLSSGKQVGPRVLLLQLVLTSVVRFLHITFSIYLDPTTFGHSKTTINKEVAMDRF